MQLNVAHIVTLPVVEVDIVTAVYSLIVLEKIHTQKRPFNVINFCNKNIDLYDCIHFLMKECLYYIILFGLFVV